MKWSALLLVSLLWLAPAEAKKLHTPKSSSAAAHRNVTPRAKRHKFKKFKPTGRVKAKRYSRSRMARRNGQ